MFVKTLKVKSKDHPDLPFVIINESDFDDSKHKVVNGENATTTFKSESLSADDLKNPSKTSTLKSRNKDLTDSVESQS
jgi:hypothetical protein